MAEETETGGLPQAPKPPDQTDFIRYSETGNQPVHERLPTTVTLDRNGWTEEEQHAHIREMAEAFASKTMEVKEAELLKDPTFMKAAEIIYRMNEGEDAEQIDGEKAAEWYLDYLGKVNYSLLYAGHEVMDFQEATDEQKLAMAYGMKMYDSKDVTLAGVGRFLEGFLVDDLPINLVGIGSVGAGFVAKSGMRQAAKKAFMKFLLDPIKQGMIEGAVWGAADDLTRQSMEKATGQRKEIDPAQTAATAAMGAGMGAGAVKGVQAAGKAIKKAKK